ncbi:MAG: DNA repair protein RecO, partial [Phycisphaerales bacterium]|nr:DNA repair protein RecO [Phycisphaerales bacterium]
MSLVSDRCICIRRIEYSETSQILRLFARDHGLIRVIAKGAHRTTKAGASRFGGGIDLLDVGEAVFSHAPQRDLPPLAEWRLLEGHRELRHNLRAIYLATYAAELVGALLEEHDPHPDLFYRLEGTLKELSTPLREGSMIAFQLDLLRDVGLLPELEFCQNCGREVAMQRVAFFVPDRGGVACRNCQVNFPDRFEIDCRLLRLARTLLQLPRTDGQPRR